MSSPVTIHVEDINDNRPSFTDLHPDEEELPDRIEHVKEVIRTFTFADTFYFLWNTMYGGNFIDWNDMV